MAKTAKAGSIKLTNASAPALVGASANPQHGSPNTLPGYQNLVALAELMGRQAAAAAIRAGAMPASSSNRKT